jgi:hypothetical protein
MIKHTSGHYEVHEVPGAKYYVWCPGSTTVECRCGENRSASLRGLSDEAMHPWRDEYRRSLEESGHPEYHHWAELRTVE